MLIDVTRSLFIGLGQNALIFVVTMILALPLGLCVTFGEMAKFAPLRYGMRTFVWMIRGTPLLLQLFVVLYAPGLLFDLPFRNRILAALIAFVINYACYFAEIYRGAIENIPKGQFEAGQVLGLSRRQVFTHIILLQVIKRITAPIGNEVITLVKDTSLARVIAVPEILMHATEYTSRGLIWPLFYCGVFFLAATAIVTLCFGRLERRLTRAFGEEPM
ncbi:MAG: amino acid ABC transporter permease [Peptococcaceae bacterium]|jgi:polar amino acid transport system permease protein|nr:amino acid ABC transporter permease [Peptococcaceae bacterium]